MIRNIETINEHIKQLKQSSYGHQFDEQSALLNAEIQKNLIDELNGLQQIIANSTDRLIQSNEKLSKSSEKFAKSLSVATWVLAGSTIALVVVTLATIIN